MSTNINTEQRFQQRYEEAHLFWRARDAYRLRRGIESAIMLLFLIEAGGFLLEGRWALAVGVLGLQTLALCSVIRLLRWTSRGLRSWWYRLGVVLVLSGSLQGCADTYKTMARVYGCDPVAIDHGYCTMPKEAAKP